MKRLRIGVIGTGTMGERHTRVCANLPRVELVGVSDPNEQHGQQIAASYETRYFESCDDLLSRVDAVTIAAPTATHLSLVERCIAADIAVMVEKPLAGSVAEAERIVELVESSGAFVQVGHIERFNPAFAELVHVTAELELVGLTLSRLSPADTSNTDVDVIRDLMIHDLDLATTIVGTTPDHIVAQGRSLGSASIDHAMASLSFDPGPITTLFASRVTQEKVRKIEVIADGAYVQADLLAKSVLVHRRTFDQYVESREASTYRQEALTERIHVPPQEPLMLELSHFAECVRSGREALVSAHDGLRAIQLAEQIAESAAGEILQPAPLTPG